MWQFYNVSVACGISASCLILFHDVYRSVSQFLMYFSEDKGTKISKYLKNYVGISRIERIQMKNKLSERAKFTIKKLNKHFGFMLEAFVEVLPQSIVQLIAMVFYQEINLISVISIILLMISIIVKR